MLNVITLFSGYDSQALALNRLGLPYDLAAWCEIDRHAITAHNALFPQWKDRNLGDVSQVDWAEWHASHPQPIDLLTYSSPCQDFSSAGLQRGGEEGSGTRSGLLWETERAVRELRPRHLVFENVAGLVSDKFIDLFNRWQARLNSYGYTNFQQLMNAKDYGVPQNRLRIFMVSILDCQQAYYFPKPFKLERRLKDVLEQNVEERYYLKEEQVYGLWKNLKPYDCFYYNQSPDFTRPPLENMGRTVKADSHVPAVAEPQIDRVGRYNNGQSGMVYGTEGVSPTIDASAPEHGRGVQIVEPQPLLIPQATKEGYAVVPEGGVFDASYPDSTTRRGRVQEGGTVSPTIMASQNELLRYEGKAEPKVEVVGNLHPDSTWQGTTRQQDKIIGTSGISPCITELHSNHAFKIQETGIRIRRLTERDNNNKNINNGQTRVFTEINEANTREVLRILWQEVGAQTFCEKMGRLDRFQKTQVLQQGVHEESVCQDGHDNAEQRHGSQLGTAHSIDRGEQRESVRDMREERGQVGCTPQGRELEEQFLGEFNDCLSQLPSETPQAEECLRYLRQRGQNVSWLLQQTLSTLEEVRQSADGERQDCGGIRIRRLSERELYRLMDVEEKDIDTLLSAPIPRTQHAKLAGNSIVVSCLYYIFKNIFVNTEPDAGTQTKLF